MADDHHKNLAQRETINLSDIVRAEKFPLRRKLTITRVGFYLAVFVFIYLALVTIVLFVDYFLHVPAQPQATNLSAADLQNYSALSNVALERTQKLFEQLVEKSMLPVLMAILGYIFGVRGVEKENTGDSED